MRTHFFTLLGGIAISLSWSRSLQASDYGPGAMQLEDQDLRINIGMDVQERAQSGTSAGAKGEAYDAFRGGDGKSNDVDFNVRRARLLLSGMYTEDWKFNLSFNADNVDRNGDNGTYNTNTPTNAGASDATREVQLFKAYLEHFWTLDSGLKAVAHAGLDFPFFNRAVVGDPWWLFPQQRASGSLMGDRSFSVRFMLQGTLFDWGFDIAESMDPQSQATGTVPYHEGLLYTTRLEYTLFSDTGKKALYHETYRGKPGHSLLLSADTGYENNDLGVAGTRTDALNYGFEALGHWDGLSCLAEARAMHTYERSYASGGLNNSVLSEAFCVQAGYAMPFMGIMVEPALRAQRFVLNTKVDQQASYNNNELISGGAATPTALGPTVLGIPAWLATFGSADRYNSGDIYDVGINWVFSKYTLLQTSYTRWNGEAGTNGGHPDANILRAQFQLFF